MSIDNKKGKLLTEDKVIHKRLDGILQQAVHVQIRNWCEYLENEDNLENTETELEKAVQYACWRTVNHQLSTTFKPRFSACRTTCYRRPNRCMSENLDRWTVAQGLDTVIDYFSSEKGSTWLCQNYRTISLNIVTNARSCCDGSLAGKQTRRNRSWKRNKQV